MQEHFRQIADQAFSGLKGDEVALLTFDGEESEFVRFNRNAVRQAGAVSQRDLGIDLIRGARHAEAQVSLSGDPAQDRERVAAMIAELRGRLEVVPEDPHLLYATEVRSTERIGSDELAPPAEALAAILRGGEGKDSVGIHAQGPIHRGFANSLGQRNWYTSFTFNLEWCFYAREDKAVKSDYAGFRWDPAALARKMDEAGRQLAILQQPAKTIERGKYRVYLAPRALNEVVGLLSWNGFGLKAQRAKISPLLRLVEGEAALHPAVRMSENTAQGVSPNFDRRGFVKPDEVVMIEGGRFRDSLISPRSAKEYGVPTNAAESFEAPYSFEMSGGEVAPDQVLPKLGTGVYVNNLWYLNYSDRQACRMTGMTRFATFWVEDGRITAPLNVMRFDESAYRMLGENLLGLTREREMLLSSGTYGGREVASGRVPGALVEDFAFTL
jgi:predicted Zn-dependent protease